MTNKKDNIIDDFKKTKIFQVSVTEVADKNNVMEIFISPIKNEDIIDKDKIEFSEEILYAFLLNSQNIFNEEQYELGLDLIIPALAQEIISNFDYHVFLDNFENSLDLNPEINEIYKEDCPDLLSKISFILNLQLATLSDDFQNKGLMTFQKENEFFINFILNVLQKISILYYKISFQYMEKIEELNKKNKVKKKK